MNERLVWVLVVVLALVGGFFAGKYYAENHSREGFKLEWKFDGQRKNIEIQP